MLSKCLTRFSLDWVWDGEPAIIQSRATDETGYVQPHWPKPWGRAADVLEQLVIEEEFSDVERPDMGITGWVTLTIAHAGTDD